MMIKQNSVTIKHDKKPHPTAVIETDLSQYSNIGGKFQDGSWNTRTSTVYGFTRGWINFMATFNGHEMTLTYDNDMSDSTLNALKNLLLSYPTTIAPFRQSR